MQKLLTGVATLSLLLASAAQAAPPSGPPGAPPPGPSIGPRGSSPDTTRPRPPGPGGDYRYNPRFSRGDRLPPQYSQPQYQVSDWNRRGLRRPPRGYRWVRYNGDNFFLVVIATGLIVETVYGDERDQTWDRRYSRRYQYQDDRYWQQCRGKPDPAGVLLGALIGGLIGDAVDERGRDGALAGVIIGGALGAALTRDMDCEDQSYAYRTYYNGFNAGRPGGVYRWRNPHNDHRGELRIGGYYNDPGGFRCTTFTQTIYIDGRPREGRGRACRQPEGSWVIVN